MLSHIAVLSVNLPRDSRWRSEPGIKFQRYVAFGITSLIGLQAMVNMAVTMGVLPTKGLPLASRVIGWNVSGHESGRVGDSYGHYSKPLKPNPRRRDAMRLLDCRRWDRRSSLSRARGCSRSASSQMTRDGKHSLSSAPASRNRGTHHP